MSALEEKRRRQRRLALAREELQAPEVAEELRGAAPAGDATVPNPDDVTETSAAADSVLEEVRVVEAATAEVSEDLDAVDTLAAASAAMEAILADRLPTAVETALIQSSVEHAALRSRRETPLMPSMEGYGDATDADLRVRAEDLKASLEGLGGDIWESIKAAFAKIGEGLSALWKKFAFFCKSAQSQVQQFRRELDAADGEPKASFISLSTRVAHYTGLGNEQDPAELVKQLEKGNDYIYRDFFHRLASFSATGTNIPRFEDDLFNGLPGEPRIRVSQRGAGFIESPPRPRLNKIPVPDKPTTFGWIDAFLEEAMYFIQNYDAFLSTAERIYDAVGSAAKEEDEQIVDAGRKILFARTHSCIAAMEAWVSYVVRFMTSYHALLMGLRKVYI